MSGIGTLTRIFVLMFSKACQYGIRATLYVASRTGSGLRTSLRDIAAHTGSPEAFTAKILRQLVRHKIITSVKGPAGGFGIHPSKAGKITLRQVVTAIDGDALFTTCGMGLKSCSERKPCPLHHQYKDIRQRLEKMLGESSLTELSSGLEAESCYLKS